MSPSDVPAAPPAPARSVELIQEDAAAAVVAEAVAIAMEADAAQAAAAVIEVATAVAAAAKTAAHAAERASEARKIAARKAAETVAREAARTAVAVQARADNEAAQVARAAELAVQELLAPGSQPAPGTVALLLADIVTATAQATATDVAGVARSVATAVAHAAAQMVGVTAASDNAHAAQVSAAADAVASLAAATALRVALDSRHHTDAAAAAARDAAAALEVTSAATRIAGQADQIAAHDATAPSGPPSDDARHDVTELLASVAHLAAAALPVVDGVGMTWSETGRADVIVGTSDAVRELAAREQAARLGPAISASTSAGTVRSGSLATSTSWPDFGRHAAELGVHSVVCVPLTVDRQVRGSMSVCSEVGHRLDDHTVEIIEAFAASAARLLRNAQAQFQSQRVIEQLRSARGTAAVINQAVGIMMSRSGYSPSDAINGLRLISQAENRKLHVVAARVVGSAVRRARRDASSARP